MMDALKLIPIDLLDSYCQQLDDSMEGAFYNLEEAELSTDTFSFYTSVASVFSSKIEGEEIDLDSYIKHKKFGMNFQPDHTKKIDDLYNAYIFAKQARLNHDGINEAHKILTKHILAEPSQSEIRHQNMYVTTPKSNMWRLLQL